MAKFHGMIGYIQDEETSPGIHEMIVKEVRCSGDILRDSRQWQNTEVSLNDNIVIHNRFSVVVEDILYKNLPWIRYILWNGTKWQITSIEVQRPRLIFTVGGVYNG